MAQNNERDKLHSAIWKVADELRGSVDGWDFKEYIITILFYRFLSENIARYINEQENNPYFNYADSSDDEFDNESIKKQLINEKGFFIKPSELFCNVVKRADQDENLNETLEKIFQNIESSSIGSSSEEDIKGLFSILSLNSQKLGNTVTEKNRKLANVLKAINDFNLGDFKDNSIDLFGDAYEFLMAMYAKHAGKSGGEFFTPQEVSELLARLTIIDYNSEDKKDKKEIENVYDPCCGSGSLLLKFAKILGKDNVTGNFCGQELNLTTYNLARINMFLHDINFNKFHIFFGDTLLDPKHNDYKPFEAIVSNPPYSTKWEGDKNPTIANDERFRVTALAPASKADFAFVLHIYHYLASYGAAAIVEFPGILYRSGKEAEIRKYLVQNENAIDAIIQLPDNLFFGTSISTCIITLRKNKLNDTSIFFVDASKEFVKKGDKNSLSDENISHIIETIRHKKEIENFSRLVPQSEIIKNNFNLSVNSYITKESTKEKVDIKVLNQKIRDIVKRNDFLRKEIDAIVAELEEGEDE